MARQRSPRPLRGGGPAPRPVPEPTLHRGGRQPAGKTVGTHPVPPRRPATTPSGGTTPPTGAQQAANADATAIITMELQGWGFGQDAINWAASEIASNKSTNQILADLRAQPFYENSIFGQTNAARQAAGLPAMTEQQILTYKDTVMGTATNAGIPTGFITDADLVQLMGKDVSATEVDSRITTEYVNAVKAPQGVRDTLNAWYGTGTSNGALAAYYLDPNKALPLLQQQLTAAQLGAAATRTNYGTISRGTAEQLASLGVTESQGETSFAKLGGEAQLFNALPGSGEQAISQQVQLAAEFGGDAQAQQEITQRADQRKAEFAGSYRYAETAGRGITGLGPAPRNG